jgi:2-C-methyl-D-erythritol 4-phosphate cytidylyltransferase
MVHVTWGILIAAGKGEQINKEADIAFLSIGDSPVLAYSLTAYERCPDVDGMVVVASRDKLEIVANMVRLFGCSKVKKIVPGAVQRMSSVASGLRALEDDVTLVSVHDVSRPCVAPQLITDTIKAAKRYGSGVAAARMADAVKEAATGQKVTKDLDRSKLWMAQTPQTFRRELLEKATASTAKRKKTPDDEAEAVRMTSKDVHLVPSDSSNLKIQTMDDVLLASALLRVH